MKILVLEDDDVRIVSFRKMFFKHQVTFVKNVSEAIGLLQNSIWDELYLDHDLGGSVMVESGPGTGYEVARWLELNPNKKPRKIILHSFNPVGIQNMAQALPDAIIAPGIWDKSL